MKKFIYIIFSTQLILCPLAFSEDLDINRCDSLFCPTSSGFNTPTNLALKENTGIYVQPATAQNFPQVRRRTTGEINDAPASATPSQRIRPQGLGGSNGGGGDSQTNGNGDSGVEKSSIPASPQSPESSMGQSGGSVSQFNSPNGANNNSQLKAGLLYSNDDEEPSSNKPDTANKSGSALTSLATQMDPVKQNLNNSSVDSAANSAPFKPGSGTKASDFGTYQSGDGAANKGFVGKIKDELAEIAASLGENFFGDLGGKSSSRKSNNTISKNGLMKNGKNIKDKNGNINPRDLLKRGLAQFEGRGLANKLEFSASNTSLFGNMCKHYVNYALKNSIPNDRTPCPLK
jgi:hypothetical protein